MTRLLSFSLAFTIMTTVALAEDASANPFIGKWEIDTKKTQAAGVPGDLKTEIRKSGDHAIVVKSRYQEPKTSVYPLLWVGVMAYELPLNTDGTERQNQIGTFMHVSKTTFDGNAMTTDWRATIEKGNVEGKWIRTLSPDGKEMTLQIVAKASDGRQMDQKLIFKRR
ncbi:MAG: hypothetical protein H7Y20_14605 [Bryobacteraceae bacterium]|nr:hypothetical protein [Bryobacteraceae bacterium]